MKRLAFRLASAVLALAICFGASARGRIPTSYAPSASRGNTAVVTQHFTDATVFRIAAVSAHPKAKHASQPPEALDTAAQFDATR